MNKILRNIIFSFLMIFSAVKPNEIESVNKNEEFKTKLIKAISSNNLEEVKNITSTAEFSNFISSSSNNFEIAIEEALGNLKSYESKKSLLKNIGAGILFVANLQFVANAGFQCLLTNGYEHMHVMNRIHKMMYGEYFVKQDFDTNSDVDKFHEKLDKPSKVGRGISIIAALLSCAATAKVFKSIYKTYKNVKIAQQILKILELSKSSNSQQA